MAKCAKCRSWDINGNMKAMKGEKGEMEVTVS